MVGKRVQVEPAIGSWKVWQVSVQRQGLTGDYNSVWQSNPFPNGTLVQLFAVRLPHVALVVTQDGLPSVGGLLRVGKFGEPVRVGCRMNVMPAAEVLQTETVAVTASTVQPEALDDGIPVSLFYNDQVELFLTNDDVDVISPWQHKLWFLVDDVWCSDPRGFVAGATEAHIRVPAVRDAVRVASQLTALADYTVNVRRHFGNLTLRGPAPPGGKGPNSGIKSPNAPADLRTEVVWFGGLVQPKLGIQ